MRIFLVGYMGSGKSLMGAALAKELGVTFFDLDKAIEKKAGKDVTAIFAAEGEKHFRDLEKQCLALFQGQGVVRVFDGHGAGVLHRFCLVVIDGACFVVLNLDLQVFLRMQQDFFRTLFVFKAKDVGVIGAV